jgi:glutamyl-tRNA synthetase
MRAALFNWAFARHHGGAFVFRIEDTDAARDSEESYRAILDALRWLGLNWDEGPEVGGPHAPYRQSLRTELYRDAARRLLDAGEAYESFSTPEEVEARHRAAGRDPKLGYDNYDRDLTEAQKRAYRDEGRPAVLRLRMPDHDISWRDLVRGETTFKVGAVPDFALTRGNGDPLYTLVNPYDDAVMRITHVLRGEDLLPSTPRQLALHAAFGRIGIAAATPQYGHLPLVLGQGNKKLSKRDPEANFFRHRDRGFLPEGLGNYLALLGWSIAEDRDVFSLEQMVWAFDVGKVSSNPARFDQKKADAINAEHIRMLDPDDFADRLRGYLSEHGHPVTVSDEAFAAAAELVQTRIVVLGDAWDLLKFLLAPAEEFVVDEAAAAKNLKPDAAPVLAAAIAALDGLADWRAAAIEEGLKTALIEGMGLKPRVAFAPVRVAVTGSHISPPLFESMELLGREASMARLRAAVPS